MPERSHKLVPGVLAALVLGIVVVLVLAVGVSSGVSIGCESCHVRDEFASASAKSPHDGVACKDCHGGTGAGARVAFGAAQVTGMVLKVTDVDPTLASVDSARCKACHGEIDERVSESSGLRIAHKTCAKSASCTDCHSPTAHGSAVSWPRTTTMAMCFECHGTDDVPAKCDMCHAAKLPADRIKTGAFAVTHGPNYLKTHGMGDMRTCTPCHDSSKCSKCHGGGLPHAADFLAKHSKAATAPDAKCTSCHVADFCSDCHGYEMPHPARFLKEHSKLVDKGGDKACQRCHKPADCTQCHEDHVHPTTLEQLERLGVRGDR